MQDTKAAHRRAKGSGTLRLRGKTWQVTRPVAEAFAEHVARNFSAATGEMRVLFAVGAYTGLRLGDCATLRWDAVDMDARTLTVTPRKTARRGLDFRYQK